MKAVKVYVFLLFFFCCDNIFGQDRTLKDHLSRSEKSHIYLEIGAGLRTPFITSKGNNYHSYGKNLTESAFAWEGRVGVKTKNDFFIETGITHINSELNVKYHQWTDGHGSYGGFDKKTGGKQYYIPVNIKKKVFSINQRESDAGINLNLGIGYLVSSLEKIREQFFHSTIYFLPYTENFRMVNAIGHKETPFIFEGGLEFRGTISQTVIYNLFVTAMYREPEYLYQKNNIDKRDGETYRFDFYENGFSLKYGIKLGIAPIKF